MLVARRVRPGGGLGLPRASLKALRRPREDPNNAAIPEWRPSDLSERPILLFDAPSCLPHEPHAAERRFMDGFETQQMGHLIFIAGPNPDAVGDLVRGKHDQLVGG